MKAIYSLRFTPARGAYWVHERNVSPTTALDWLKVFQKDEPAVSFAIGDKKPRLPR